MKYSVHGKKIWLIGASTGIGAALARELALEGAIVLASARNVQALQELKASLPGVSHEIWPLDVTQRDVFLQQSHELLRQHPDLEMVIYNPGVYNPVFAEEMTLESSLVTLETNLTGAFVMLDAVLPVMLKRGGGHLVLVSSVAGYCGLPRAAAYSASKAGLTSLAETLCIELQPKNITVQVVCPGFVRTRLTANNPFPMPLSISPEQAALAIMKGIERRQFEIHFPQGFTIPMKIIAALPRIIRLPLLRLAIRKAEMLDKKTA